MTGTELFALLPLIVITLAAIVVMLTVAFHREHSLTFVLTLAGFALSFAAAFIVLPATPTQVTPLLIIDRYAIFYMA
ncbi:MAG TPA: NADH-quinone oxidoreductase subunit N, partial [Gammaproteobacteria bacterium]|nr:NADH-quinone oxidoreductase subunit N [Gammaproteobacteria bacterium]